jgi:hypothetical protein
VDALKEKDGGKPTRSRGVGLEEAVAKRKSPVLFIESISRLANLCHSRGKESQGQPCFSKYLVSGARQESGQPNIQIILEVHEV